MKYDVFISYRRNNADAHAKMISKDLNNLGYKVFLDYESIGSGNFLEKIYEAIENCKNVLVLLTKDSLDQRIFDDHDIMEKELEYAILNKKNIVGIMVKGFDKFPDKLPEELETLPFINCVSGQMEYYEAMIQKLTSGKFLMLPSRYVHEEDSNDDANKIEWFKTISMKDKMECMNLLLSLQHEFNTTPEIIRLYNYIDIYFRNIGIYETPKYDGVVPTDIATYLSFFETFYLLVATETIDISLVDELFRFRFFAMVNNPFVQDTELLPLGNQYPNILKLYNMWSNYIINICQKENNRGPISEEIYLYENDYQQLYNAYSIVMRNPAPKKIYFYNKSFNKVQLSLRQLQESDVSEVILAQSEINNSIQDVAIFAPLTNEEIQYSLSNDNCYGLFFQNKLVAYVSIISHPDVHTNLALDFPEIEDAQSIAVVDCIFVKETYRGYGIQKFLVSLAKYLAQREKNSGLIATVSPQNEYSSANMLKSGFTCIGVHTRYGFPREYYIFKLNQDE